MDNATKKTCFALIQKHNSIVETFREKGYFAKQYRLWTEIVSEGTLICDLVMRHGILALVSPDGSILVLERIDEGD